MINKSIGYRALHFPLTKIVIGVALLGLVISFAQMGRCNLLMRMEVSQRLKSLLTGIIVASLSIGTHCVLFRYYEKIKISELSFHRFGRNLLVGSLFGAILQSLTILVIYLNGGYFDIRVNTLDYVLSPFVTAFTSAIFEQVPVRGKIFRIMKEKPGSYTALVISAQAGLLLGAAFIYSKNLWFPIAIHFAWNFTLSGIYGASVSGNSLFRTLDCGTGLGYTDKLVAEINEFFGLQTDKNAA